MKRIIACILCAILTIPAYPCNAEDHHEKNITEDVKGGEERASCWAKSYGGQGYDAAYSIQESADGGYVVAGYAYPSGAGEEDFWIIKLDSYGNIKWQKSYGGSKWDRAYSIQQTKDGGYIVMGETYSFGGGVLVIKLDSDGNIQWQKSYGGNSEGHAYSILATEDGGYILVGDRWNPDGYYPPGWDAWIIKLDSTGNITWQKTYGIYGGGGGRSEHARAVLAADDGGYIVAGYAGGDSWIIKLDSNGSLQWQKNYGESGKQVINSIQGTEDGGYIAAGVWTSYLSPTNKEFWVMKLDSYGDIQWQKSYGGPKTDSAVSVRTTEDGGYIVVGGTSSFGSGGTDFWIIKLDSGGYIKWQKTYGGIDDDTPSSILALKNGGFLVAGQTKSFGAGYNDMWVLRLPPSGNISFFNNSSAVMRDTNAVMRDTWASSGGISGRMSESQCFAMQSYAIVTSSKCTVKTQAYNEAPDRVQNLSVKSGIGYVEIHWEMPEDDGNATLTHYSIHRGENEANLAIIANISAMNMKYLCYNDTNVTNGKRYFYAVAAWNYVGEGLMSIMNATPGDLPSEPTGLSGRYEEGKVILKWNEPEYDGECEIIGYKIYRGTSENDVCSFRNIGNSTRPYYSDENVSMGSIYYYSVSAVNGVGESKKSALVEVPAGYVPSKPLNLTGKYYEGGVLLKWDVPSANGGFDIEYYRVYRGFSKEYMEFLGNATTTSYIDEDVKPCKIYFYTVSAVNRAGEGGRSDTANVPAGYVPSQVRNLTATYFNWKVMLQWKEPSDDGGFEVVYYKIYRGDNWGRLELIGKSVATNYIDTHVLYRTYYYAVSACNIVGEGEMCNAISIIVTEPPVADFTVKPTEGDVETVFNFKSTSYDLDGEIMKCAWDFGDGYKTTGKTAIHKYKKPGEYNITLTVTDNCGVRRSISKVVKVIEVNHAPKIISHTPWNDDIKLKEGEKIIFSVEYFDKDNDSLTAIWYVDNMRRGEGKEFEFNEKKGNYVVMVVVSDGSKDASITWNVSVRREEVSWAGVANIALPLLLLSLAVIIASGIAVYYRKQKKKKEKHL